jgi:hypothetical protein
MPKLLRVKQVITEAVAEVDSDFSHKAGASAVFFEVVIDTNPFLVVVGQVLVEVLQEVLLWRVAVNIAGGAFEDGNLPLGAEAFSCYHLLGVHFTILRCAGFVDEVDAKVLAPGLLVCLGVTYWWPEVQVEGYLSGREEALAEFDFCD